MNENPGETPNPLNPTPEMEQGGELMSEPDTQPASAPEPRSIPNQISTTEFTQPIMEESTEANTTVAEEPAVDNLADSISAVTDPTARPMQQAPVATEAPKKKKKNGLFIGAIIFLFLAIACGVAAALIFLNMDKIEYEITQYGLFDSTVKFPDTVTTQDRLLDCFEIELYTSDCAGTAYINQTAYELKKGLIICGKPGQYRHSRLHFKCCYLHLKVENSELNNSLMQIDDTMSFADFDENYSLYCLDLN